MLSAEFAADLQDFNKTAVLNKHYVSARSIVINAV